MNIEETFLGLKVLMGKKRRMDRRTKSRVVTKDQKTSGGETRKLHEIIFEWSSTIN